MLMQRKSVRNGRRHKMALTSNLAISGSEAKRNAVRLMALLYVEVADENS